MVDLVTLALVMLLTGAVGGLLAGLLGVGGGIIIVPVLDAALSTLGTDPDIRMHVAVATSLATIIPTSLSSSLAHRRKGAVDFDLTRRWAPYILIGAILGSWAASNVDSAVLSLIFGLVALLVAGKMLLPTEGMVMSDGAPRGPLGTLPPFAIGGLSTMMGIGGGTLSVPVLTMTNYPIHRAVGTAALFGLFISVPGTLAYMVAGWNDPRLPAASLGYVNAIGFAFIAPATVFFAPYGARLAHWMSKRQLSLAFGGFLLIVSCRMLYRALVAT
jgi:uncharacterized membrane protein YfcA